MNDKQKKHIEHLLASGEFKGQKHQDKWVLFNVLPFLKNGYFLDLAAADGITHSNTHILEKHFGWNGLCIEPNPIFYKALTTNRNCQTDRTVVSDKEEMLDFRIDNGQLGGVVADDTDNSKVIRGNELPSANIIQLQAKPINEILLQNKAPKIIDYFSLDVEGCEERIISTLDFDTYQFKCLTIERPTEKVNEVLFDNGYVFVRNFSFDSYYVHPQVLKETNIICEPFEQVPKKDW
ncbi:MAG TPA: FkbM family methyltransferase [Gammaproteobacteria bacterium]|nr:FkbM family methyltransferase [Gammaproteobacteria bacterium]